MLPAGLDILGRPKGENRIAHGLQPWEDGPERNRPERAAEGRSLFPNDNPGLWSARTLSFASVSV
jgi:hypothetical protein